MTIVVIGPNPWPWATRHCEPWTATEDTQLMAEIESALPVERIARRHGRRPGAIAARMGWLQLGYRTVGHYSLNAASGLLGVDSHTVTWWANEGWLSVRRTRIRMGRGLLRTVTHEALCQFLADERHWHLWGPARITDSALREWACEARGDIRFLTTREAGDVLGLTEGGVNIAIREGRLWAVKCGSNWALRSDQLHMPERRRVPRGMGFSPAELGLIRERWGLEPATAIARRLGRACDANIHRVARCLGLPRIGRGYWRRAMKGSRCAGPANPQDTQEKRD